MDNSSSKKIVSKKNITLVYKTLLLALTVMTVIFSGIYVKDLYSKVDTASISIDRVFLATSALVFLCSYGLFSLHWLKMCRVIDEKTNSRQFLAFFASQPYKYLPSSIFSFSFRAKYASDLGLGVKKSSAAQLLENIDLVFSGVFVGFIGFVFTQSISLGIILAVLTGTLLPLLYILSKYRALNFKSKKINLQAVLQAFMLATGGWILSGFAFYLLSVSVDRPIDFFTAISANAFGYIAGLIAIFAPGGIGVREAVFSVFITAPTLIIGWRLLTFFVDIIIGLGADVYILYDRKKKSSK